MNTKTNTQLPLDVSAVGLKAKGKRRPCEPTVVLVDGQKCLKIPLTKGMFAIIDEQDFQISNYRWHADFIGDRIYARRGYWMNHKNMSERMHRRIMGNPDSRFDVDHANGNGLDNRRCNLRICVRSQNNVNSYKVRKRKSRFKGVTSNGKYWKAMIGRKYLGTFRTELEAANEYDIRLIKMHGKFAHPNFKS